MTAPGPKTMPPAAPSDPARDPKDRHCVQGTATTVCIDLGDEGCYGCGNCNAYAPKTFIIGDDLQVTLTGVVDGLESLLLAAEACPTLAVSLYLPDGRPIYPQPNP